MKPITIFSLESENMTGLGGPMGTEHTWANWTKLFRNIEDAKKYALKDYRKETKNKGAGLEWVRMKSILTTGDLRFVCYNIRKLRVL